MNAPCRTASDWVMPFRCRVPLSLGFRIQFQARLSIVNDFEVNDTLDRVQKAVEEFFKKTRTTLFEFDKAQG